MPCVEFLVTKRYPEKCDFYFLSNFKNYIYRSNVTTMSLQVAVLRKGCLIRLLFSLHFFFKSLAFCPTISLEI